MKIFTIYDSKASAFNLPFFKSTPGLALREFEDAAGDPQTTICAHPEDFTLFEIGEFDFETGVITLHESKLSLANGVDVKKPAAHPSLIGAASR